MINRPDPVATETRARVQSAIDRLGYVRSESARQLRAGRSRIMGLLVLDMGNPFFVDVARGAERAARDAGLGVMVCNSAQSAGEEAEYLSLFAEQRVRGVLLTPADATGRNIETFRRHNIPFVLVDRVAEGTTECSVSVDDVAGGALAGRPLVHARHRSIAPVHRPPGLNPAPGPPLAAPDALPATGPRPGRHAARPALRRPRRPEPAVLGRGVSYWDRGFPARVVLGSVTVPRRGQDLHRRWVKAQRGRSLASRPAGLAAFSTKWGRCHFEEMTDGVRPAAASLQN